MEIKEPVVVKGKELMRAENVIVLNENGGGSVSYQAESVNEELVNGNGDLASKLSVHTDTADKSEKWNKVNHKRRRNKSNLSAVKSSFDNSRVQESSQAVVGSMNTSDKLSTVAAVERFLSHA